MDAGGTRDCFGDFKSPATSAEELFEHLSAIIGDYSKAKVDAARIGAWARCEFNVDNFVSRHVEIYRSSTK
jgi:hypothetical protein